MVIVTLVLLAIPSTQARGSNSEYSEFLQALVEHHIQILPRNIERDSDVRCLALNIYYEARGEPILGRLAVANVTINRFLNSKSTICSIVYSPGQFEWTKKRLRGPTGEDWYQALALSWVVLTQPELIIDVTNNSTYFHSHRRTPGFFRRFDHTVTIGNHRFYRERPLEEVAVSPER